MRDLGQQFRRTLGANTFAQIVTVGGQLAVLPVLLLVWGGDRTGSWLILVAMTSWLSLADLGFANVAANAMTMETASGRTSIARQISDSAWAVWAMAMAVLLGVFLLVVLTVPLTRLGVDVPARDHAGAALVFMVLGVGVAMAHGVAGAAMRAQGQMHRMVMTTALARAAEFVAIVTAAVLGVPFWGIALAMLGARAIVTTLGWRPFFQTNPAFVPGIRGARWARIRALVPLSLGYFLFNIGHAVSVQGSTLVLGAVLGPGAVVVVTAVRTMARAGRMMASVVIHATEPLFAQMAGRKETARADMMRARLMKAACFGALIYVFAMAVGAAPALRLWTGGVVTGVPVLIAGFTAAVVFEIFWFTAQAPFVSTNRHGPFAKAYVAFALIGLAFLPVALGVWGLAGAALVAALIHGATLGWTLYRQRRPDMGVLATNERLGHAI